MGEYDYSKILKSLSEKEKARGSYERLATLKAVRGKSDPVLLQRAIGALVGEPYSAHDLSVSFDLGDGVKKDAELSFYWSKLAAENGDSMAQNNLANKYSQGIGTVFNGKKAVEWYRKSCAQGQSGLLLSLRAMCGAQSKRGRPSD